MRVLLRLLLMLFFALAVVRLGFFVVYAWNDVIGPTEAYYLEAKAVHLAWRVQQGVALYPDWTDGPPFVTNFFGPLYFLIVGGLARLMEADFDGLTRIARLVTVAAGGMAALAVGVVSGRREGPMAGLFAATLAIGSAPMVGFGAMARPDVLADLLGFLGFLAAAGGGGSPGRRRLLLGGVLLVSAIFTKQTAGLYLLAALLAMVAGGSRRSALMLAIGSASASALVVLGVTFSVEPRFAIDLLGEAGTPSSPENWRYVLWRLWALSRELILLSAVGFGLWTVRTRRDWPLLIGPVAILIACSVSVRLGSTEPRWEMVALVSILPIAAAGLWGMIDPRRPRDLPLASLAAVQLIGATLAASKLGSELNYFLGLRLVAALAGGVAWGAVQRFCSARSQIEDGGRFRGIRGVAASVSLAMLCHAMIPGTVHDFEQMRAARRFNEHAFGPGRELLQLRREIFKRASDPETAILSDSGEIQLRLGERAPFVDPWLFRVMVMTGRIDPVEIRRRLESREYAMVITTEDLSNRRVYDSYDFGLPPELAEAARQNYRPAGEAGGLFLFSPRRDD